MSLTATVFIIIFFVGIIATLYHPIYGVMFYFFEWHNHPPYWWWGSDWPDPRWSLTVAMLIVISSVINRKKLVKLRQFEYQPLIWLVLIIINSYLVSYFYAIDPSDSYAKAELLFKYAINYFLMIYIIRNPRDYNLVILVILLGVANFGRIAWEEGSNRDLGVIAPSATSGNLIASYMMSIVPLYATTFLLGKKLIKIFTAISLPFVLNALILENSRGTILGLFSMAALAPFFVKGRMRWYVVGGLIITGLIFLKLTNQTFWERQSTTVEYQEDRSAESRFLLWKGAYRFIQDYPFGGGGDAFVKVAHEYVPEMREIFLERGNRTVHNTYLNVGTDWGYLGLFLFLGFLIHTVVIIRRIKKEAKNLNNFKFYYLQSIGLLLAIVGITVAYVFYSRQYAENIYWFSAFAVALRNIQLNELSEGTDFDLTEKEIKPYIESRHQLTQL